MRVGAEAPAPQRVRQESDGPCPGTVFLGEEFPPEERLNAEDGEEVAADSTAQDALGHPVFREVQAGSEVVEDREMFEDVGVLAPEEEPRNGELLRALPGELARGLHHATGLGERQRPEKQAVDDAPDRGVRADGERQSENGDDREPGTLRQTPGRLPEVLDENVHHAYSIAARAALRAGWPFERERSPVTTNEGRLASLRTSRRLSKHAPVVSITA